MKNYVKFPNVGDKQYLQLYPIWIRVCYVHAYPWLHFIAVLMSIFFILLHNLWNVKASIFFLLRKSCNRMQLLVGKHSAPFSYDVIKADILLNTNIVITKHNVVVCLYFANISGYATYRWPVLCMVYKT